MIFDDVKNSIKDKIKIIHNKWICSKYLYLKHLIRAKQGNKSKYNSILQSTNYEKNIYYSQ
jgi:hypothetical protein